MELRSEQKKGCVGCVDVHSCPDAFTTDSQYCNSYGSIIVKSDSSDFLKSINPEFLQCSRLLFDDFEERFLEYVKTLNLPVDFRLERYGVLIQLTIVMLNLKNLQKRLSVFCRKRLFHPVNMYISLAAKSEP